MAPPAGPVRVVVSDAGPLICLGRLDLLHLLPALFASVQVPEPVLQECSSRPQSPDAARILAAVDQGWLNPCGPQPLPHGSLGRGERAAIARALAIGADLLSDDLEARTQAESLQLRVIGTLGVLVRGKRGGLIPAVAPLVEQLRASGQRFGHGVVSQVLAAAGERSP